MNSNKNVVIFMQGAPGSGKSTKARELAEKFPEKKFVIVNKDSLRNMTAAAYSSDLEQVINYTQKCFIVIALNTGHSVIVDNTNFNAHIIDDIIHTIETACEGQDIPMYYYRMTTSLSECIQRNVLRDATESVPVETVKAFYNKDNNVFPKEVKDFSKEPLFDNTPNKCIKADGKDYWMSRSIAVVGLVLAYVNGKPYVLVAQRGKGAADNHGKWNVPCGYLDYDETLVNAAVREIYEETGVYLSEADKASNVMILMNDDPQKDARQNVSFWYKFTLNKSFQSVEELPKTCTDYSEPDEVSEVKWMPLSKYNLIHTDFAFNHGERLQSFFSLTLK